MLRCGSCSQHALTCSAHLDLSMLLSDLNRALLAGTRSLWRPYLLIKRQRATGHITELRRLHVALPWLVSNITLPGERSDLKSGLPRQQRLKSYEVRFLSLNKAEKENTWHKQVLQQVLHIWFFFPVNGHKPVAMSVIKLILRQY